MILVIHKFELLIKKKGYSSNNIDRNIFRTNLKSSGTTCRRPISAERKT